MLFGLPLGAVADVFCQCRTTDMIDSIIQTFSPITLDEMKGIRLMNRTDTKFVASVCQLERLLQMAKDEYSIQEIAGKRNMDYATVYYDSPDYMFYNCHHNGHARRQKVRIRSYVETGQSFLEVKTKDNHGKTRKCRVAASPSGLSPHECSAESICCASVTGFNADDALRQFLLDKLNVSPSLLERKIANRFRRITLVNRARTERLTIDTGLEFYNICTGESYALPHITVIELKRDGLQPSPVLAMLRQLRIHPSGFSKYCIGEALTNPLLRKNRFKQRIRYIMKLSKLK